VSPVGPKALRALREALGSSAVEAHEPRPTLGVKPSVTLRPPDGEALAAAVRTLGEHGMAALVRGSGSRLGVGNPPTRADVILETAALESPLRIEAEEGVAFAAAGVPLWKLQQHARAEGWEVPLDPPGPHATVGGALAQAAVGPRSPQVRDLVLGLDVVVGNGTRARCGGRVVKNVSGYDLAKLYVGSHGSLGVIAGAWLRLWPLPEAHVGLELPLPPGDEGWQLALAVSRRPTLRAAGLVDAGLLEAGAVGRRLIVALEGDAAAVEVDRKALGAHGADEVPDAARLDALRQLQGSAGPVRIRIAGRAVGLGAALEALAQASAGVLAYPGKGLLWGVFSDADPEPSVAVARRAARAAGGHLLLEEAPLGSRRDIDAFDVPAPLIPLHRALKQRFDPRGVLNPGRFGGHL